MIHRQAFLIGIFTLLNGSVQGQYRPFPQDETYPYGYMPGSLSSSDATDAYTFWKSRYLVSCGEVWRVKFSTPEETRSEGIGYGMLLTAYHGEREYFDGLLEFYKIKRTQAARQLMAWDVTCDGITDGNCATDGDLDVAFALAVAYNQWGGSYLDDAKDILEIIREHLIVSCGDTIVALRPGVGWGGCHLTDMSYYTPGFFRVFAGITGDTTWDVLADDSYRILAAAENDTTGLVPDWHSVSGIPSGDPPVDYRTGYYRYDASRTPWRLALDYLWNGDTLSRDWCTKISDWAHTIGPSNIVDGYELDGTPVGQYHNSAFVGGFTIGSMCNSQSVLDDFADEFLTLNDSHYFNLSLRCLYMLVATGNFWKPETDFITLTSILVDGENGKDYIDMDDGTLQMEVTTEPDSAFDHSVTWSVVNGTGIASISETGLLTAVANGTVAVVATAKDQGGVTGEMEVTITNQTVLAEEIIMDCEGGIPKIIVPGGTLQLYAEVLPVYASIREVSWRIKSGEELAVVSDSGLVTALANGNPVVEASAKDGSGITGEQAIRITSQNVGIPMTDRQELALYPNPAKGILTIENPGEVEMIEIMDLNGKMILSRETGPDNRVSLDISGFINGQYLIRLISPDGEAQMVKFQKL